MRLLQVTAACYLTDLTLLLLLLLPAALLADCCNAYWYSVSCHDAGLCRVSTTIGEAALHTTMKHLQLQHLYRHCRCRGLPDTQSSLPACCLHSVLACNW